MSHDKISDYLAYRNVIKMQLRLVGLWPDEDPKIFYRLLPYPFLFVSLCVTFGMLVYVRMHSTNIASVTKALSMITSFLTIILKMMCILANREDTNELQNILDLYFTKLLNNQQISTIILTDFHTFRRLSWTFTSFAGIIFLLLAAIPIISIISQHHHSVNPIIYPLVYPTAYPWSVDPPGFRYKIHLFIELAAIVPHFCVSPSIDSLFMMYGFHMIGQFREMSHRITHINNMADGRNAVRECVRQHQSLRRCRDLLQKIFGPILLWVITTNAISLCSFIFQLTQMKSINISTMIIFALYIGFKVLQTFVYAYTGSCLTSESENYRQAIYDADWLKNRHFMTSILIMLSQKPIILSACNFTVISLDIFVKVLNTTISYFFLLQAVS